RELAQSPEDVRRRTAAAGRMPEALPRLVGLPVVAGVEELDPSAEYRRGCDILGRERAHFLVSPDPVLLHSVGMRPRPARHVRVRRKLQGLIPTRAVIHRVPLDPAASALGLPPAL